MMKVLGKGARISITRSVSITNLGVCPRDNLLRIKDVAYVANLDHKEYIGFHYLLTKIRLHTLIYLVFAILCKKY